MHTFQNHKYAVSNIIINDITYNIKTIIVVEINDEGPVFGQYTYRKYTVLCYIREVRWSVRMDLDR